MAVTTSRASATHGGREVNQLPHRNPPLVEPRLWRSADNKVIAGVVGGLAERMKIDPTLARVLYAMFSLFSGMFPGFLIYVLLWYIAPVREG